MEIFYVTIILGIAINFIPIKEVREWLYFIFVMVVLFGVGSSYKSLYDSYWQIRLEVAKLHDKLIEKDYVDKER
jgi:uncharacterized membrane protein YfhO